MGARGQSVIGGRGAGLDIFVEHGAAIEDHIGRIQPAAGDQGGRGMLFHIIQRIDILQSIYPDPNSYLCFT